MEQFYTIVFESTPTKIRANSHRNKKVEQIYEIVFELTPTETEPTPPQAGVNPKTTRADSRTTGREKWLVF